MKCSSGRRKNCRVEIGGGINRKVTGTTSPQGTVGGDPHHHHTLIRLRDRETEGTGIRLSSTSANLTDNQQQRMLSPAVSAELFLLLSLFLDMCLMSLHFFPFLHQLWTTL
jgi:hypothetical protein